MFSHKNSNPLPTKEERLVLFGSVPPVTGSKPVDKERMQYLQNQKQNYLFEIDSVGISQVKHPISVLSELEPKLLEAAESNASSMLHPFSSARMSKL